MRITRFGKAIAVFALCATVSMPLMGQAEAKVKTNKTPKIVFIPLDNRPISDKQTADVAKKAGYDVIVPGDEILGNRDNLGHPEELWNWLETNAQDADAAVIAADSMLYGSLVGSRKHTEEKSVVLSRVEKFQEFRKAHPKLNLYVFGSVMRTPRTGEASGHEEPGYYRNYGADIFRYTELKDKQEVEGLTSREKKEYAFLEKLIPQKSLEDWMGRRMKNFEANKEMIGLTRKGVFNYFVLGRDDNAPYSQTHYETRHLLEDGKDLGGTRFQSIAGIDEMGMLMLARAINDMRREVPFIYVHYNWGRGEFTVPSYSDEKIGDSIAKAILATGAMQVRSSEKADLVLTVNTNPDGKTYEANMLQNDGKPREGTKYFADIVSDYVAKGYPVAIADIAFANGSDNALMGELKNRGLLFKLQAYAGWNTATNSTGFVLGEGMLTNRMTNDAIDSLLVTRYLDDWGYQANVRNTVARQLTWLRGDGVYGLLGSKKDAVSVRSTRMLQQFVEANLPPLPELEDLTVTFPWNRMFESDIIRSERFDLEDYMEKKRTATK